MVPHVTDGGFTGQREIGPLAIPTFHVHGFVVFAHHVFEMQRGEVLRSVAAAIAVRPRACQTLGKQRIGVIVLGSVLGFVLGFVLG